MNEVSCLKLFECSGRVEKLSIKICPFAIYQKTNGLAATDIVKPILFLPDMKSIKLEQTVFCHIY